MTGPIRTVTQGPPGLSRGGDVDADGLGMPPHAGGPDDRLQPPPGHLDRTDQHQSSLDRLLAGADTLARFRGDPVSLSSSPVTQPGEIARAGDVQADAGAHLTTPVGRGPDVTVGATVTTAGVDARLSFGGPAATQPPWVNATVQVREPGQIDRAAINLRLIGSGQTPSGPPTLGGAVQGAGFNPAHGPSTTGMLTVRGAVLEIAGPHGRTVLLATTDGGAVMRTGAAEGKASVFIRAPDGFGPPPSQPASATIGTGGTAINLAAIGLAAGSLAGLLSMLGGPEQQMAIWLARPDGNPAAFPPADDFKSRWSDLKERLGNDTARLMRLEAVLYDVMAARFAALGVDLAQRSPALRDVVWATAVEHGPWATPDHGDVLSQLERRWSVAALTDAALIRAVFDEQLRTGADGRLVHYPELGAAALQSAVTDRLAAERQVALDRLAAQS